MRMARAWLLVGVVTSLGCTSGLPPEEFAAQFAQALCERAARCHPLAPYVEAQCEVSAQRQIAPGDLPAALKAGHIRYDPVLAQRCIDLIARNPCLEFFDVSAEAQAACYAAVRGTVAPGGFCSSFFECQKGRCSVIGGGSCPGICPQTLDEGEQCSLIQVDSVPCDDRQGLLCSPTVGLCVKPKGAGEACGDNFGCVGGLVCVAGTCQSLRELGQPCTGDEACVEGLACIGGGDEGGGHCEKRRVVGELCGEEDDDYGPARRGSQCADGLVCKGLALDLQGQLTPGQCATASGVGGDCLTEGTNLQELVSGCQEGLVCVAGSCQLPPSSGPCSAHDVCRFDTSFCDGSTATCQPLHPDGETCVASFECASAQCVNGRCGHDPLFCRAR